VGEAMLAGIGYSMILNYHRGRIKMRRGAMLLLTGLVVGIVSTAIGQNFNFSIIGMSFSVLGVGVIFLGIVRGEHKEYSGKL